MRLDAQETEPFGAYKLHPAGRFGRKYMDMKTCRDAGIAL